MTNSVDRLSKATIRDLMLLVPEQEDRDDMAIPSYLHWNPLINWLFWKRLETVVDLLPAGPLSKVMDYGCGIGSLLPTLSRKAELVLGVDKRPAIARALTSKLELKNVNILDLHEFESVPPDSIDVIVSADVLEHVEDLPALIEKFKLQLAPSGSLIISGPTENALYKLGRKIAGFSGDYHVRSVHDIDEVILNSGFNKISEVKLPVNYLPQTTSLFHITHYCC